MRFRKQRLHPEPQASFPGYGSVVAIASGAFATVYRAVELGTSRPVALKLLRLGDASQSALDPLSEHLDTLTLLSKHPNVLTLYRTFFTPEDLPVLVTELCRESLAQRLARNGPLSAPTVVPMAVKVAGALETAHKAGLVHGDVKPENILISAVGEPLLGDFGLASLQAAAAPTEHLAGEMTLHTPPEAFEDAPLTPAADVYGLASSIYQLLLGRGPVVTFPGEEPAAVILRVLRDTAPRPPLGSMPIALADLLEAALSKTPADRPPTAASFAESLRSIEEASGWPPTPYVVWEITELSGARPLRTATIDDGLKDGEEPELDEEASEAEPGKADRRAEGGSDRAQRVVSADVLAGEVDPSGPSDPSGPIGPSDKTGQTEVPTSEVAAHGWATGEASADEPPGSRAADQGGPAGTGPERAPGPDEAGPANGADEADEADEAGVTEGAAGREGATGADVQQGPGPTEGGASLPGARQVIVPPAVERTVVVPNPLPPFRAATSHPAHAVQPYRHSARTERPAG
jgi:eukaryotic-like serine/threonine-protein kinase